MGEIDVAGGPTSNKNESKSDYNSIERITPSETILWATLHDVKDRHANEEGTGHSDKPASTVCH